LRRHHEADAHGIAGRRQPAEPRDRARENVAALTDAKDAVRTPRPRSGVMKRSNRFVERAPGIAEQGDVQALRL
jgi:hypothetical protein